MSERYELELTPQEVPGSRHQRRTWYLVTNQLNLMFMLAAGLVTGPKGFGRKYYRDPLCVAPGWIPLFAERIPAGALKQATAEESHLEGIAAAIDLSALRGSIRALDGQGQLKEVQWPDEASGDEQMLFVPAPLPIGLLHTILFPTKDASTAFRDQAADYANVPIDTYKLQVKAALFRPGRGASWPLSVTMPPDRDQSLHRVAAVGAVQALMVGLGNRGGALVTAARLLADCTETSPAQTDEPLLRAVLRWVQGTSEPENGEVQARMLGRILCSIVDAKADADSAAGASCAPDQAVLSTLDEEREWLTEPKSQQALTRLIDDLRGLLGLSDATVSELLKRQPRPFSRGLILFFLRQRSEDLLEFARDQPLLTDCDLMVAAALFGARDGWIGLPPSLKNTPRLTVATTQRMAVIAHREGGSGLELGPAPPRVRPLLELLQPGESGWTKSQREGALALTRAMDWQTIITTRISLGKGDYRLQVDARGAHLFIDGDAKAVETNVDPDIFFDSLARASIPPKVESEVRSILS